MATMGSEKQTMPPRENARFGLQGVPAEGFSSRPGASGERSRTQRSVTAHKAAGGRVSCNLGGTTELSHSLRPFVGAEAVFVFACHKNTASGGGRRKNHEERYSYAMDRFE